MADNHDETGRSEQDESAGGPEAAEHAGRPEEAEESDEDKSSWLKTLATSLWFPMLFFFGFLFCYMLPFHAPAPHDVKVAVSGPAYAEQVRTGLEREAPGAFKISPAADAASARRKVLDRETVAAYAAQGDKATLFLAKAAGAPLEDVVGAAFGKVAAQSGRQLTTVDLTPTASGDPSGTGLFYLAMVWNIVPYIAVMMLMRVVTLSRLAKVGTLVGTGVFISVVGYLIALAMDVVPDEPLAILYAFMITQAVAWTTYGLVPFVRQFIPGVAITLFVLLSIPSSGGAIPYQMVPGFFRALHPIMPLGNLIDALHGLFYFDGKGMLRPTLVLCAWLAVSAALIAAGGLLERRKAAEATGDAEAEQPIEENVEDPSIQAPTPHALHPGSGERFGEEVPMLTGTVCHADGTPAPNAFVTVLAPGGRQLMHTTTDKAGRYAAAGLPEDFLAVLLLARDHSPVVTRLLVRTGHTLRQDFVLDEAPPSPVRSHRGAGA
ncbi:carboxypeptidase regulatory-like domain-containing protein [Streptomyces sp. NPDC088746]|uniref:carboxypeptidase regulatory-like domain-containing protein n=1 Tax=Streptomyces sp. NPDC088746 TaxID=3365885 RepID=UPI003802A1E8